MNELREIRQALGFYRDPQAAARIWDIYFIDLCRYGLQDEAFSILERAENPSRLDILLDGLIRNVELENTARKEVRYSPEEDCGYEPNATQTASNFFANEQEHLENVDLSSSAMKPVVLYDKSNRTKLNTRFWNTTSKKHKAEI